MENIHILTTSKPSRLLRGLKGIRLFKNEISPDNQWCVNVNISITSDEEIKEGEPRINNCQRKLKGEEIPSKKIILTTDQDLIKDGVQGINDEFLNWFIKNPGCDYVKVVLNEVSYFIEDNIYRIVIPKEEPKTAWVGVLHDKLNEYHPAEYELKDIYQGEGCLPNFPDEELCQIWCDSKYKEEPKQTDENGKPLTYWGGLAEHKQETTLEEFIEKEGYPKGVTQEIWEQGVREGANWRKNQYTIEEQHVEHSIGNLEKEYIKGFNEGAKLQQERSYSEEEVFNLLMEFSSRDRNSSSGTPHSIAKWFEQFKK